MDDQPARKQFLEALAQFEAEDALTPISQVVLFEQNASFSEVVSTIKNLCFSRYPVYKDGIDNIIGVLHARSLIFIPHDSFRLSDHLSTPQVISENKKLDELFEDFNRYKNHFAIVVDEHGSVRGIITMEDILESVLGELKDEFDASLNDFEAHSQGGNQYTVDARMELEDFNARFQSSYESEEYGTIGGYMMEKMGKVPREGDSLSLDGYTLTVLKAQGPKLLELSVVKN